MISIRSYTTFDYSSMINRYLREEKLTASLVWEQSREQIERTNDGFIVFDDSVIDKNYSKQIESVRTQYSGNAHGLIRGIGMVNCIYVNPTSGQFWVIDYRIFDPERDGKSKMEHVKDMLSNVHYHKQLPYKTVLMDSWYASKELMLFIADLGKLFYCPVKSNRLSRGAESTEYYQHIATLPLSDEELKMGKQVRLKDMPNKFFMKLFRVPVSTNRTDHVVTNDVAQHCADDTRKVCAIRWLIEQFHRELKQLTGIEQCQCRKQRIQRNHIACAVLVWVRLKHIAYQSQQTVYQIKRGLLRDYLIQQLKNPEVCMAFA